MPKMCACVSFGFSFNRPVDNNVGLCLFVRTGLGWSTTRTVCTSRTKLTTGWVTWTVGSKTPTTGWRTTSLRSHRLWPICTLIWPSRCSTVRWSLSLWPEAANRWAPPLFQVNQFVFTTTRWCCSLLAVVAYTSASQSGGRGCMTEGPWDIYFI